MRLSDYKQEITLTVVFAVVLILFPWEVEAQEPNAYLYNLGEGRYLMCDEDHKCLSPFSGSWLDCGEPDENGELSLDRCKVLGWFGNAGGS